MSLGCGGKTGRAILIGVNVIFLIIGLVFLIIGIVMRVDNSALFGDEVRALLDDVDITSGLSLGTLISALNIIFIVVGVFCILVAGMAIAGALAKFRPLLIIYVIIIIIILLLQIACVVLWFTMRQELEDHLTEELFAALGQYEGEASTNEKSQAWDEIFIDYECCGTVVITDSQNGMHFGQATAYWASAGRGSDNVPASCCPGATKANYKSHTNTACTVDLTDNNQKSCSDALLDELIEKYSLGALILMIILVVIEIVSLIFSIIFIKDLGDDDFMV